MIKHDDFDFEIVNFPFLDGDMFLAVLLTVYTFCNLLGLIEFETIMLIMARTWTR